MKLTLDNNFYYTVNGIIIHDISEIPKNAVVQKNARLLGGKGGFGSMLRAIGSQIEKTTNREMCRDLNGRRMRDVNNEKKLKEWLDKAGSREREKLENYLDKRRKRKLLLEQGPSAQIPFEEKTAEQQRRHIADELQEAICDALERRKFDDNKVKEIVKPKKININIDSDLDSSSSSSPSLSPCRNDLEHDYIEIKQIEVSAASSPNIEKIEENIKSVTDPIMEETTNKQSYEEPCQKMAKFEDDVQTSPNAVETIEEKGNIEKQITYVDIDLEQVGSVSHLLTFGGDWIKNDLMRRGLKCGGTLMERAQRLFSVKGLNKYPEHLLIGQGSRKRK